MEEITQDNLILEGIEDWKKTIFYLTFLERSIKVIKKFDEEDEEWFFETDLSLTEEDKEAIKSFCEEQENQ